MSEQTNNTIQTPTPEPPQKKELTPEQLQQRRKRIAAGSGRTVQEVNQLLKQWSEMNKMMGKMRQMANGFQTGGKNNRKARRQMNQMMRNMGGGNNMGGMGGMGGFPF